ncbi:MAG TPA: dockerin type I domain-containing protein [Chthoniobacterales bacterium]
MVRSGWIAISLLLASALTASAVTQQTLYVATGTLGVQGILYTIDPATGAVLTTVGNLNDAAGNNYDIAGLCYDPLNGIFYAATGGKSVSFPSSLITIDRNTALVTPIGPFGAVLTDIAVDPTTGVMYGVSGFNQKFYTVDLQTGVATQTGSTGLGFQNGGGLAADSTGALYGVDNFSFYSYDKTTGAARLVGLTLLPNLVRAADFDSNNAFYGVEGGGGADNTHLRFLVTIDLTTGLGRLLGPIIIEDLDGLAFLPVPLQLSGILSEVSHGSAGTFDIDLTSGTAVEPRNPAGGNSTLILTFPNNLRSVGGATVGCGSVSTGAIGPNPNQYTVNLTGQDTCNAQYNTVTLSNVNDALGNHLDTLLSPRWGLLVGDTNGDGSVNSGDIGQTKSQSGQPVTGSNFREDVTAEGSINSGDIGLVKSKSGTALP